MKTYQEEHGLERIEEEEPMDVVTRIASKTLSMRGFYHDEGVDHSQLSYEEEEEEGRDDEVEERNEEYDEEEAEIITINNKNKHHDHHVETNDEIIKNRGHHLYQEALNRKHRLEKKLKQETNEYNDKQTRTPKAATREELERLAHRKYMKAEEYKARLEEKRLSKMKSEQEQGEMNKTKKSVSTSQGQFFDTKRYERHRRFDQQEPRQSHFHLKHGNATHPTRGFAAKKSTMIAEKNNIGSSSSSSVSSLSRRQQQASDRLANLSEQGRLKLLARNNIHNRRSNLVVEQRGFSSSRSKKSSLQKSNGVSNNSGPSWMRLHSLWRQHDDTGKSRRMEIEQRLAEKNKSFTSFRK